MPRSIDRHERLDQIAAAVERIAAQDGVGAVTFRRIAECLGASTTVVTHWFATRDAMLEHVLQRSLDRRREEIMAGVGDAIGATAVRAIVEWAVLEADDGTQRFWVALVSARANEPIVRERLDVFNDWWDATLRRYAEQVAEVDDVDSLVDAVSVIVNGLVVGGVETSGVWPRERRRATLELLISPLGI